MKRLFYSFIYWRKFLKAYDYKLVIYRRVDVVQMYHTVYLSDGWEQDTDIKAGLGCVKIWYKRKKQN